jgi:hypothetical protein
VEKRQHPRIDLADEGWRAELINQMTGKRLGEVVNLSLGGLLLLTATPLEPECLYQVELVATGPNEESEQVSAGVVALWRSPAGAQGTSWVGLQIIDISDDDWARLMALMERCGARSEA